MKRILWLLLFLCFALAPAPVWAETNAENAPQIAAQGAALVDGRTGRVLWEKDGDTPMTMASTTKILTAVLVLENADLDGTVEISRNAARQPEVHMDLREGEEWKVGDLLSAMMLRSYNDAAVALAEYTSGSVEEFCAEMTAKAAEIGAKDTVFGSPNGLDSSLPLEQHHSTASDMARIAAYALENEDFCRIVALPEIYIAEKNGGRQISVTNADRFLREYDGAMGVKTGYTNKAGHCFVGAAERDGVRLVSAVLGSGWGDSGKEKKWTDTRKLMDYGFAQYENYRAVEQGTAFGEVHVLDSPVETVGTILGEDYEALFSKAEQESLRLEADLPETMEPPVCIGDELGTARLMLGEETLAEIPLLADADAPCFTLGQRLRRVAAGWLTWREF
ncbi:MAG: D-alanyl-D-alanine carboxypeptidase [Anaerotignum sp.]|nr:D-alanyl-D-alanine carboxypeptidase [Anaerotignum sp.]